MNPNLVGDNSPFSLLQNMTNAAAAAGNLLATTSVSENNENSGAATTGTTVDLTMQKKRKLSESSDTDLYDLKSLNKKYKNDQFDFLYNYFLQNEPNEELKKQDKHMMDFDSLYQYYQMSELKKKGGNFDYLYQYYLQNEKNQKLMVSPTLRNSKSPALDAFGGEKPSIDFLFQYYQINESKKFFQLDLAASASSNVDADLMASLTRRHKPPPPIPDAKTDNLRTERYVELQRLVLNGMERYVELQQQQQQQQTIATPQAALRRITPHYAATLADTSSGHPQTITDTTTYGRGGGASKIGESTASLASSNASLDSFNDQNQDLFNAGGSGITSSRSPDQSTSSTPMTTAEKQNNKRLRTTILPEQLNFLYECYQNESNPSRKMLEEISKKVNLKKRVVQVGRLSMSSAYCMFSIFHVFIELISFDYIISSHIGLVSKRSCQR